VLFPEPSFTSKELLELFAPPDVVDESLSDGAVSLF
jgi:hypothetical protein